MSRNLYSMQKLEEANLPEKMDFFIIAAGADYRAYENSKLINLSTCKIDNLVVYSFSQRVQPNDEEYSKKYEAYLSIKASQLTVIHVEISDPSKCALSLCENGIDILPSHIVGIDISCFTKPYFYVLLKFLSYIKLQKVLTFYTQPVSYRFSESNYRSFRSSNGPITVKEVPSFPGVDTRAEGRLLIIILGFDRDLSTEIEEIVAPTKTLIVNGFPGFEPKFKDISLISNERLLRPSNKLLYSRSTNPFEIYNLLDCLKTDSTDDILSIAPLGNKPMALGACLFAIHNPNVRVIYPYPQEYENIITNDCSISWLYTLPLIH